MGGPFDTRVIARIAINGDDCIAFAAIFAVTPAVTIAAINDWEISLKVLQTW